MPSTLQQELQQQFDALKPDDPNYATATVDVILAAARRGRASDVHLVPAETGMTVSFRIDGVLQEVAALPRQMSGNVVSRLKVLAELLTYQTEVPQEGRIRDTEDDVEMRVSTFPTLYGEKAVIRLFVATGRYRFIDDLGLPETVAATLQATLSETGGAILATGPAGSGKTTTVYACLRELARACPTPRSLATLEDPIETVIEGAAQSQIRPAAGFDYQTGLRSLLRQDPEVILVGEIRDKPTAEIVFQAALTGHLVLTTFHAGSAAEAVGRLLDMGIEPYQLRSGLLCVLNQRLVRRLCRCAIENNSKESRMGLDVERVFEPAGCQTCGGTGYHDRMLLAEMLLPGGEQTGAAILSRSDTREIETRAFQAGMITRWQHACEAVSTGRTSPAEIRRVLGFR